MPSHSARSTLLIPAVLLFGLGCPSLTGDHTIAPIDGKVTVAFTGATTRGAYLVPGDQKLRVCAEPMPDAALDQTLAVLFELAHKGKFTFGNTKKALSIAIESDGSTQSSRTLTLNSHELGGRNPTVLIAREFLYRLCELNLNIDPSTPGYKNASLNYATVAAAITKMAEADASRAEAAKADAGAKKADAETKKADADAKKAIADAELLKVQMAAQAQVIDIDVNVGLILALVTREGATCTIDKDRMKATLAASHFDEIRDALAGETSCAALKDVLRSLPPSVLRQLSAAALLAATPAPATAKK